MKKSELKTISESLINTFNEAGKISIDLYKKGLKIEIKEDKSPVSNGDLRVNELITNKISGLGNVSLNENAHIIFEESLEFNETSFYFNSSNSSLTLKNNSPTEGPI